ncbi:tRNA (adenosine(37)-N6)-threonylcarbamoyltransferase complex dimerization subunit type 1 TsaB [Legionella jamestowniensis]|uniref:tRNA threonylcarbamoyladenosine biosynthesis protein TsaB n=1 Tax=Legionella jamestowniensis TaxID=455 RepID=A0A0W0UHM0_9GAMM|nr:tRNA (adenosine(37)-N6)-threonylcarbamoyltransferase complex dimerization subunit type 1 TsaB [Legionella jamestowniensis]KTD07065.1 O-sialoglycoprotein endopeptidase [Legionella jamestowniensis]SFM03021.1 tRNA threonylcarbamoyladenosine biosynthesis protein TsaB [Legionella jamestowniensis DSM 19215]
MNLLAIDTSTTSASVALCIHGKITSLEQGAQRQHAQLLLPMIEQLLTEAGVKLNQLDGIVYGRGPGSFTGLRIACSVAKGLAYAHDLPLYPVSSLATIAEEAFSQHQIAANAEVLALIDARMNQVYWGCYTMRQREMTEGVCELSALNVVSDLPLVIAGVGFEPYLTQLPASMKSRVIKHMEIYPHAQTMIHLVLNDTIQAITAAEAVPVYVRNQITQGDTRG